MTWGEVDAWARMTGRAVKPWEASALVRIAVIYRNVRSEALAETIKNAGGAGDG